MRNIGVNLYKTNTKAKGKPSFIWYNLDVKVFRVCNFITGFDPTTENNLRGVAGVTTDNDSKTSNGINKMMIKVPGVEKNKKPELNKTAAGGNIAKTMFID